MIAIIFCIFTGAFILYKCHDNDNDMVTEYIKRTDGRPTVNRSRESVAESDFENL